MKVIKMWPEHESIEDLKTPCFFKKMALVDVDGRFELRFNAVKIDAIIGTFVLTPAGEEPIEVTHTLADKMPEACVVSKAEKWVEENKLRLFEAWEALLNDRITSLQEFADELKSDLGL